MNLDPGQARVFRTLKNQRKGACLITGDAGTGKTTLAAQIARWFLHCQLNVLILTPTHVARQQFSARVPPHNNLCLTTVASYLGQHPQVNKETERLEFTRGQGSETAPADLVIVDETSMVSEYELTEIALARRESLVIFLGDFAQLRPVMKRQGDAYRRLRTFYLREQHRNQNAILALCNHVRNVGIRYPDQDEGEIRVHEDRTNLVDRFLATLERARDPRDVVYLAYRNAMVNHVRMRAHRLLYGSASFCIGQWLRLDQMCEAGHNGSVVRVVGGTRAGWHTTLDWTFMTYRVRVENPDTQQVRDLVMAALSDQARQRETREQLYEASATAFRRDKDRWSNIREQIEALDAIVMHSSPFVGTVHKSQGRTVSRVFVDTLDINSGSDKRRLLYVGYSRSQRELHVIRVPERYQSRAR